MLPRFVRLSAELRPDKSEPQTLWFDVPEAFETWLSLRGEPWALFLLPHAVLAGQDIALDLPVDPLLLRNLKGVQQLWHSWYGLKPVEIIAPADPDYRVGEGTGLFFSGGLDSFFSLVEPLPRRGDRREAEVDTLLMVWGFDIALVRPEEFALARALGEETARRFGKRFIPIATNLRDIHGFDRVTAWWTALSHGAALAGIAHLLSGGLKSVVIGSSHDYGHLEPWASHPLLDPLFSSGAFTIVHDGAAYTRVEKTESVSRVPDAAGIVRVCYKLGSATNCSRCSKCLRTMMTFDLLGCREIARSFDWSGYSMDRVAGVFLRDDNDTNFFLEVREAAERHGRADIVTAIDRSVRHSRWKRVIYRLCKIMKRSPVVWRFADPLRHAFGL